MTRSASGLVGGVLCPGEAGLDGLEDQANTGSEEDQVEKPDPQGEIIAELERLRKLEVVRLVDLVVVAKDDDGDLALVQTSDLTVDQAAELGAIAGALIGLGAAGEEGAEAGASL